MYYIPLIEGNAQPKQEINDRILCNAYVDT